MLKSQSKSDLNYVNRGNKLSKVSKKLLARKTNFWFGLSNPYILSDI